MTRAGHAGVFPAAARPAYGPDDAWLARDNEPDAGPWNAGLDGINFAGSETEPEAS